MSDSTKMKKLFSCLFGSALYGTRTPTSDRDIKHVCLVPLDDLLLGKKVTNVVKKTNTEKNTRNTVNDVDEEFIPIQVFAKDFMMGQTYALELAFAVEGWHAEQRFYWPNGEVMQHDEEDMQFCRDNGTAVFVDFAKELRKKFLTSNIKAMMGYVVNQASLYSFKGERLNVTREVKAVIEEAIMAGLGDQTISEISEFTAWYTIASKYPKYFKRTEYDIGGRRMKPCFTLLEKTLPFTNKIDYSLTVVNALESKYGSRADAASATNVDWKATMHALRIVDEGLHLLESKHLEFPFKPDYVQKLLSIKRGEVPLDEVTAELTSKLDRLKQLEQESKLPAWSGKMQEEFDSWLAHWMKKFYNL